MARMLTGRLFTRIGLATLIVATVVAGVIAVAAALSSPADAQDDPAAPANVVAMVDTKGVIRVSWDRGEPSINFYTAKWKHADATTQFLPYQVRRIGRSPERPGYTFDPASDRHGVALEADADVLRVAVRSGIDQSRRSAWSEWSAVSDGLPVDVSTIRAGSDLRVSWSANPIAASEPVLRYALWYRQIGESGNGTRVSVPKRDGVPGTTVTLPGAAAGTEVQIRAVYPNLGSSAKSPWYRPAADLTEQCRPGGEIHTEIGATGTYAEKRIPLEGQVWFFPTAADQGGTATGDSFGHAHLLTCIPHRSDDASHVVRTEALELDVRIQVHLQPAFDLQGEPIAEPNRRVRVEVPQIEIRGRTDNANDVLVDRFTLDDELFLECDVTDEQCVATVHFVAGVNDTSVTERDGTRVTVAPAIDLFNSESAWATRNPARPERDNRKRGFTSNGFKQLRVAAIHEVYDGGIRVAITRSILRSPFDLDITPDPADDDGWIPGITNYRPNATENSGWLMEPSRNGAGGYATIGINGQIPVEPLDPAEPWSLSLHVEADPCGENCAVTRMPVTVYRGFLDPAFHGTVEAGQSVCGDGTATSCLAFEAIVPAGEVSIDPTVAIDLSQLSPGRHRLVLAVEQPMVDGQIGNAGAVVDIAEAMESTLTGLLVVHFEVA